jgi:two-component system LytT family response regulator
MRIVIIEDEPLASERLQLLLQQYGGPTQIAALLESVDEAVKWFSSGQPADLILSDIQLADGSAFEIFRKIKISHPVIFTTAFDKYALDAFKLLSIDYLLKPVTLEALSASLNKLKLLQGNPEKIVANYGDLLQLLMHKEKPYKSRFTGKIGNKLFFIDIENIALFYSDNKIVYIQCLDNMRYISDHTLENIEHLLDPTQFFRINRGMITNINAINQVRPYDNNRLQIQLKKNIRPDEVIVSRERVHDFRKWANN